MRVHKCAEKGTRLLLLPVGTHLPTLQIFAKGLLGQIHACVFIFRVLHGHSRVPTSAASPGKVQDGASRIQVHGSTEGTTFETAIPRPWCDLELTRHSGAVGCPLTSTSSWRRLSTTINSRHACAPASPRRSAPAVSSRPHRARPSLPLLRVFGGISVRALARAQTLLPRC